MRISDWSSDVCSSDLHLAVDAHAPPVDEVFADPAAAETGLGEHLLEADAVALVGHLATRRRRGRGARRARRWRRAPTSGAPTPAGRSRCPCPAGRGWPTLCRPGDRPATRRAPGAGRTPGCPPHNRTP